jgi:hypothetical protein
VGVGSTSSGHVSVGTRISGGPCCGVLSHLGGGGLAAGFAYACRATRNVAAWRSELAWASEFDSQCEPRVVRMSDRRGLVGRFFRAQSRVTGRRGCTGRVHVCRGGYKSMVVSGVIIGGGSGGSLWSPWQCSGRSELRGGGWRASCAEQLALQPAVAADDAVREAVGVGGGDAVVWCQWPRAVLVRRGRTHCRDSRPSCRRGTQCRRPRGRGTGWCSTFWVGVTVSASRS